MITLDIGCGKKKVKGSIGMDIIKHPGVDVVHDMIKFPYPFEDNYFDVVESHTTLEHIEFNKDFFGLMDEVYRILKPGGLFKITVPYWKGVHVLSVPEHTRLFSIFTFYYFDHDPIWWNSGSGQLSRFAECNFKVIKAKYQLILEGRWKFLNFLSPIYNISQYLTEGFLSNFIAPELLVFELKKVVE